MPPLNPAQRAAVEHHRGPLLVLAGAGSGKTRVITHRIAKLLERGVRPNRILAVSFTNKAAAEMGERMAQLVGPETAPRLWLSTFHSFGVRFLGEENRALGYDGRFVIFDQGDALGLVKDVMKRESIAERTLDAVAVLSRISLWKNAFLAPEEIRPSAVEYDEVARQVYPHYERSLRAMHAVDFDDLVVAPVRLLRDHASIREKWQARFEHLLIDEFQDTNKSQLELVRYLANEERNVCVVGDDDQSIYGWRGAEVGNILDFERYFRGAMVVKLEQNYRSREPILSVANAAIAQSRAKRHEKKLVATRLGGDPVKLMTAPDTAAETRMVVREIRDLAKARILWKDIAVLYRSNQQARMLEEELRIAGVPYRLFGGTQFFDRKEIKDAIAYLRVVVNPRDELSLRRVVNYPARGLGDTSLDRIAAYALRKDLRLFAALSKAREVDGLAEAAIRGAEHFVASIRKAQRGLESGQIAETARQLLADVGLGPAAYEGDDKDAKRRRENQEYLLRSIARYEESRGESGLSLAQFLTRITLRFDQEEEDAGNRVTLSSLHSAKGLEFGYVFLIGCVEGVLPHSRTTDPKVTEAAPTDVEEERRLFYVGVTRAKERLYLSRPERRTVRGRVVPLVPSRFLHGLPEEFTESYAHAGDQAMGAAEMEDMTRMILDKLRGG
jgi:DNA helicase-2/ATP-dependent DNA helicase PcrA